MCKAKIEKQNSVHFREETRPKQSCNLFQKNHHAQSKANCLFFCLENHLGKIECILCNIVADKGQHFQLDVTTSHPTTQLHPGVIWCLCAMEHFVNEWWANFLSMTAQSVLNHWLWPWTNNANIKLSKHWEWLRLGHSNNTNNTNSPGLITGFAIPQLSKSENPVSMANAIPSSLPAASKDLSLNG